MQFSVKIISSCIWVAIPVDWVILLWYACGADERSGGRSVYGHVITKFYRMGSLPHFFTHGAPLRAVRARELRYYSFKIFLRYWLAKITRIIHHKQLLSTKFGRILWYWTYDSKSAAKLQIIEPLTEKTWGQGWVVLVVITKMPERFTHFTRKKKVYYWLKT